MSRVNNWITKNQWMIAFAALSFVVLFGVFQGLYAFFSGEAFLRNSFTVGSVNTSIQEEFDPPEDITPGMSITKKVAVHNDGSSACYVRVKAVFSSDEMEQLCSVDWNDSDWIYDESDGYWYYPAVLESGDTTPDLFTTIKVNNDIDYANTQPFDIIVYQEAYQARPYSNYADAWAKYQDNLANVGTQSTNASETKNWIDVTNESDSIEIGVKLPANEIHFENGTPSFLFNAQVEDGNKDEHVYRAIITFDQEYVKEHTDSEGNVTKTTRLSGIPSGVCRITEEDTSRYRVQDTIDNGGGSVTFTNERYESQYYSDTNTIINSFSTKNMVQSIRVSLRDEYQDGFVIGEDSLALDIGMFDITAVYRDGSTKQVTPEMIGNDYTISPQTLPEIAGEQDVSITIGQNVFNGLAATDMTGTCSATVIEAVKSTMLIPGGDFDDVIPSTATAINFTNIPKPENIALSDSRSDSSLTSGMAIDVSDAGDQGVLAWMDSQTMIVSSLDQSSPIFANPDCKSMFFNKGALVSIDFSNLNTSNVTTMNRMFMYCEALSSIDVSSFDTKNVTDMMAMFYECHALTTIPGISNFDTRNVTDMMAMFYNCWSVTSLDVTNFDTSKVTDMSWMFRGCGKLTGLDVTGFDTSNVTDMNSMFNDCGKLTALDVAGFDTSKVTDMNYMFYNCYGLHAVDVTNFDTSNVTNMDSMFCNCSGLTTLDVTGFDTSKVTNMRSMFATCSNLSSLDVTKFDTAKVTDMSNMFRELNMSTVDVTKFDTSNVTNMHGMFYFCSFTSLDVSKFNTSSVTDMSWMFTNCHSLKILDVSHFDTSKVTDLTSTFADCDNLASLDVSGFDTGRVTKMNSTFYTCKKLSTIDVSKWDTSRVTDMYAMFDACQSLQAVDLTNFNTSRVTDMSYMFNSCESLTILDLSSFNTSKVTDVSGMFQGCTSLQQIYASDWTSNSNIVSSTYVFYQDFKLRGGIQYNASKISGAYCKVSGGYFTQK